MHDRPRRNLKSQRDIPYYLGSRLGYSILGACAGFALAIWLLTEGDATATAHGALTLAAGAFFGAFAGFDLHATRHWSGRFALLVRLVLSCSTAGSLTALCGALVGVVPLSEIGPSALLGAGIGLLLWLNIVLDP